MKFTFKGMTGKRDTVARFRSGVLNLVSALLILLSIYLLSLAGEPRSVWFIGLFT